MLVKIKICGITQFEDARVAVNLGADALGFVFIPDNPRYIEPLQARAIIQKLPPFITTVGVFADASHKSLSTSVRLSGIDCIQLNGAESPEYIGRISLPVIKSFTLTSTFDSEIIDDYPLSAIMLNTWNAKGGIPKRFDWSPAADVVRRCANVIITGGLGLTNIHEAIAEVEPYAVDVCESVEIMPGVKNPHKMKEIIAAVKKYK